MTTQGTYLTPNCREKGNNPLLLSEARPSAASAAIQTTRQLGARTFPSEAFRRALGPSILEAILGEAFKPWSKAHEASEAVGRTT